MQWTLWVVGFILLTAWLGKITKAERKKILPSHHAVVSTPVVVTQEEMLQRSLGKLGYVKVETTPATKQEAPRVHAAPAKTEKELLWEAGQKWIENCRRVAEFNRVQQQNRRVLAS